MLRRAFYFIPMTLEDLTRESGYGIQDPKVQNDLKSFVNRAQRTIAERYNFSCLFDRRPVVIPSGFSSQDIGADFKQLNEEPSPVSYQYGTYQLSVCVVSRSEVELWGIWPYPSGPLSMPVPGGFYPARVVFFERNAGGNWTINIPPQFQLTQEAAFWIKAYWYPTPLQKGSDENPMTRDGNLNQAIISLTQCFAFKAVDPTDKRAIQARLDAEDAINKAMYADSLVKMQGRSWRM